MSQFKPVIFGFSGLALTREERDFFSAHSPFGYILFARNCDNPSQLSELTGSLRDLSHNPHIPILIDQEGGRVARLKPPHWRAAPPAAWFGELGKSNAVAAKEAAYLNARLMADELHHMGINVNCAPMVDIRAPGSHDIIGDRAYAEQSEQVVILAREVAQGLMDGGVLPVIKHIPGHGRAKADSHESLPVVEATLAELEHTDFVPFKKLRDLPFAMTAHIVYTAMDKKLPATLSPRIIAYIRENIGFENALMSDDISMKALSGDLGALSKNILSAGCDLVLHCNGKMDEMQQVAAALKPAEGKAYKRCVQAMAQLRLPQRFSASDALARLSALLPQERQYANG